MTAPTLVAAADPDDPHPIEDGGPWQPRHCCELAAGGDCCDCAAWAAAARAALLTTTRTPWDWGRAA